MCAVCSIVSEFILHCFTCVCVCVYVFAGNVIFQGPTMKEQQGFQMETIRLYPTHGSSEKRAQAKSRYREEDSTHDIQS